MNNAPRLRSIYRYLFTHENRHVQYAHVLCWGEPLTLEKTQRCWPSTVTKSAQGSLPVFSRHVPELFRRLGNRSFFFKILSFTCKAIDKIREEGYLEGACLAVS